MLFRSYIEQVGAPLEVYRAPASRFVAAFIGSPGMNILEVAGEDTKATEKRIVLANGEQIVIEGPNPAGIKSAALRPEAISLHRLEGASRITLKAGQFRVLGVENLGDRSYCYFSTDVGDLAVTVAVGTTVDHFAGDNDLKLYFKLEDLRLFGPNGQAV